MIRVRASSRLHFGLLSLPAADQPRPARSFGGVGLMVQKPGVCLTVRPAPVWSAEGPLAERALGFARRFAASVPAERVQPQQITVEPSAPEHAGLGTGTQLGLAVGRALAQAWSLGELDAIELARRVGRGERSALGIHGFAQGGLLIDGGKGPSTEVAPLIARLAFPEAWRLVLTVPAWAEGLHGAGERQAFRRLQEKGFAPGATDTLCRLVLLSLLPALVERDLPAFGEALYEFNARVGEAFAPVQGGTYAHPRLAELVAFVRGLGVAGVGQSSWGSTLFAVAGDEEQAIALARRIRERYGLTEEEVFVSAASNHWAMIETS
jgi:beta-ribofuranosylaminobenzene 5'-phosphate synthase